MNLQTISLLFALITGIQTVINRPKTCPDHPSPAPIGEIIPDEIRMPIRKIKRYLHNSIYRTSSRGIMAGISYRGSTLWTVGIGSIEAGSPQRPDIGTLFKVSGVTQIYTSLILFSLLDEGIIHSLDDPLSKYSPNYNLTNPYSNTQLTPRQIISHMSGLPKWGVCQHPVDYVTDNYCNMETRDIIAGIKPEHYVGPAYHRPHLSNLAFSILGHFLVEITNHSNYSSLLQDKVLIPLGTCNTGTDVETRNRNKATGYTSRHREILFNLTTGWYAPAGEVYSCVKDLILLTELFYRAHRFGNEIPYSFLSPSWRLLMGLPTHVGADGRSIQGLPFHIRMVQGYMVRFYVGAMPGYHCLFSFVTELQVGFVSVWNGAVNPDLDVLVERIYKELITGLKSHALKTELIKKNKRDRIQSLSRYIGNYGVYNSTVLSVRILGVDLVGRGLGYEQLELKEAGVNRFQIIVGECDGRTCYEREERGIDRENIFFYCSETGAIAGLRMPGLLGANLKLERLN